MNRVSIRRRNCKRDNLESGLKKPRLAPFTFKSGGEAKNKTVARMATMPPATTTTGTGAAADDDVGGGGEDGGVWERVLRKT